MSILFLYHHRVRFAKGEYGRTFDCEDSEFREEDTAIVRIEVPIDLVEVEGVHPLRVSSKAIDLDSLLARVNYNVVPDPGGKVLVEESTDEGNVKEGPFVKKVAQVVQDFSR